MAADSISDKLRLDDLLRYALSGGAGLGTLWLTYPDLVPSAQQGPGFALTTVVGFTFIAGSIIYSLHRAMVYPVFYRLALRSRLERVANWKAFVCSWKVRDFEILAVWKTLDAEMELDRWRWKNKEHFASTRLSEWGAQVHLLYCAAWAILAALFVGGLTAHPRPYWYLFHLLAMVLALAGYFSNRRLVLMVDDLKKPAPEPSGEILPGHDVELRG